MEEEKDEKAEKEKATNEKALMNNYSLLTITFNIHLIYYSCQIYFQSNFRNFEFITSIYIAIIY